MSPLRRISVEGWLWLVGLFSLFGSAFFLPPLDSRQPVNPVIAWLCLCGAASIPAAMFLHLWKGWRNVPYAANREQYVGWMTLVTVFVLALIGPFVMGAIPR